MKGIIPTKTNKKREINLEQMKIKCDNCPAKNKRVRSYIFQNHKLNLCEACAALAVKLKKEEMEGWREAQKHVEKFVEEL